MTIVRDPFSFILSNFFYMRSACKEYENGLDSQGRDADGLLLPVGWLQSLHTPDRMAICSGDLLSYAKNPKNRNRQAVSRVLPLLASQRGAPSPFPFYL